MHQFLEELLATAPVITDGAWGTQLQQRGLAVGECPDLWNLAHPDRVEEVARAYVEAGSQVILTNTFGANRIMLRRHGLEDQTVEINRAGARISRRAAGDQTRVLASMGPTGAMLLTGQVNEEEFQAAFAEQARALAEGGAEGFVIETMSDPEEARLAVAAANETGLPVIACMVFDSGRDRDRTMMGTTPEQAAEVLLAAGAACLGSHCGPGPAGVVPICRRRADASARPVWIKPNAGLPEVVDDKPVYTQTPAEFAQYLPALVEAGAGFIGGCCGTSPVFIGALREKIAGKR